MAMTSSSNAPMGDINVTPLVDVMLVLLIIFMIAVPALSYPLQVDLPHGVPPEAKTEPPAPVRIHIDAGGSISWNGSPASLGNLQARFEAEAARGQTGGGVIDANRQPTLEIQADSDAEYEVVAKVLSRAKNASLVKISFVEAAPAS